MDTCEVTAVNFHCLRFTARNGKVLARCKVALLSWKPAAKYNMELEEN